MKKGHTARGPLQTIQSAVQLPKHSHTIDGGQGRWQLVLQCGHTKIVKNCEKPRGDKARCDVCPHPNIQRRRTVPPLNLEEKLKAL